MSITTSRLGRGSVAAVAGLGLLLVGSRVAARDASPSPAPVGDRNAQLRACMDGAGFPLKPDGAISVDPRAQEAVAVCDQAIINAKPLSDVEKRIRKASFDAFVAADMACLHEAGYDAESVPATDGGGSVEVVWQPGERERPSFEDDTRRCVEAGSRAEARVLGGY